MNAQQLKDSILQYAMQGKLVPQNPNDEPVTTLIENIQKEKEQLVEQKIIKKGKLFPSINEVEKPFDIPESWEWIRLGNITHFIKAGGDKPKEFSVEKTDNHLVPVIANGKKNKGIVGYTSVAKVEGNTLTISGRGTIGYAEIRSEPYVPIVRLLYLKATTNISLEYLKYVLEAFLERGVGTSIRQLTVPMVETKIIPLPPINEQLQIVKKINLLFNKIDVYEKIKKEQEEVKALFPNKLNNSILHYAIQGKLVEQDPSDEPAAELVKGIREEKERLIEEKVIKKEKALPPIDDNEIPFDIPESWEWVRLGDISSKIHYGYTASAREKGNAKLLRITDIQNNQVIWENVPYCDVDQKKLDSIVLKERDILIARTGGTIGKSFLMSNVKEVSVFASYLIRVQPLTRVNEIYLTYFLQSEIYWRQLKEMSAGTGQPNVNAQNLKKLLLPLPPLKEQARIIEGIRNFFDVTKKLV